MMIQAYSFMLFLDPMALSTIRISPTILFIWFLAGCANIVPPTGGEKDVTPPKLVSVDPRDSLLNTRVNRIELGFDEFIVVSNPLTEVTISPILPFPLSVEGVKRKVIVRIPDTLLLDNTTYRISFGSSIQDLHENNPFTGYSYIFSTGSFFDSLRLTGMVFNAATGLRDTGALVMLYDAEKTDTAVLREKPLYAVRADGSGNFTFEGLPDRDFKIYALRDANSNMVYDGTGEMIAFSDSIAIPSDSNQTPIRLDIFTEEDSLGNIPQPALDQRRDRTRPTTDTDAPKEFTYSVRVDTLDLKKRSVDITEPLEVNFNKPVAGFNLNRVNLFYDSLGISVEASIHRLEDTSRRSTTLLNTAWLENTVYTLRLLKGFAQDSAGTEAMPGRFSFRTKREDDYAKLHIHLPTKYYGTGYLFVLMNGNDTVYHQPVRDTMVHFPRLQPGSYSMRVVMDRNKNGKWDTGDLLERRQPEEVIPYTNTINLKAGWDNTLDFVQPVRGTTSGKRDSPK
jgi:hypothetical protein